MTMKIWNERKLFIKKQCFLIILVVISLIFWLIFDNRYEIFVFMSSLLSFMIGKEVEIQLKEKRKRDRFVARFRVLVSNYLRSVDSLLSATEAHPGQIVEYAKDYVNKKNLVFDFLNKETNKYLFLYDKLNDFSYVIKNGSINIDDKIWSFDDIIWIDDLIPRSNSFYGELKELETKEQINYVKNNKNIKIQRDVIEKILSYLGLSIIQK